MIPDGHYRPGEGRGAADLMEQAARIHAQFRASGRGRGKVNPYEIWWYDKEDGVLATQQTSLLTQSPPPVRFPQHVQGVA
jgi:hypothetical protein